MTMGVGSRALVNWVMGAVSDAYDLSTAFTVSVIIAAIGIIPLLLMRDDDLEHR